MGVYLPIAALRDWICSLLNSNSNKNLCNEWNVVDTSTGLVTPLRINERHHRPENGNGLVTDKDLSEREEGWPLVTKSEEDEPHLLEQSRELNSWDIAKCSLYLTPIWFATEVRYSFLYLLFFVNDPLDLRSNLNYCGKIKVYGWLILMQHQSISDCWGCLQKCSITPFMHTQQGM